MGLEEIKLLCEMAREWKEYEDRLMGSLIYYEIIKPMEEMQRKLHDVEVEE